MPIGGNSAALSLASRRRSQKAIPAVHLSVNTDAKTTVVRFRAKRVMCRSGTRQVAELWIEVRSVGELVQQRPVRGELHDGE